MPALGATEPASMPRCDPFSNECPGSLAPRLSLSTFVNPRKAISLLGRAAGGPVEDVVKAWVDGELSLNVERGGLDVGLRGKALDFVVRAAGEESAWGRRKRGRVGARRAVLRAGVRQLLRY